MKLTKAIIPVAGYGSRRLPITKAIEKCMIPVLNRPIVDYIVADCIAAGIRDFYFVVNPGSAQIQAYYKDDIKFEEYLRRLGKESMAHLLEPPQGCKFHFIEQDIDKDYGTTVPVWLCRDVVEPDEHVLVIMGDQFFFNRDGTSEAANFLEKAQASGAPSAMLAVEVPHEEVSKYGIVSLTRQGEHEMYESIVEKPSVDEAPSNLNNASFYLFEHKIFDFLEAAMDKLSHLNEFLITDALNDYAAAGNKVAVIRNKGEYLDCGNVDSWLAANNRLAEANKK